MRKKKSKKCKISIVDKIYIEIFKKKKKNKN